MNEEYNYKDIFLELYEKSENELLCKFWEDKNAKYMNKFNMTRERLIELEFKNAKLTEQEIQNGWHFCPDWDYMVIGPESPEIKCCLCGTNTKHKYNGNELGIKNINLY